MKELSTGFSRLSDKALRDRASQIVNALTTGEGLTHFPVTEPTVNAVKLAVDAYIGALDSETSGSVAALREATRGKVVEILEELAAFLEREASRDRAKLATTGYELKKKTGGRSMLPTATPQNFRVMHNGMSGQALGKCNAIGNADNYHGQWTLDPVNGLWTDIDPVSSSQKILFTGLTPGLVYYFRARAYGPNGPGEWSAVTELRIL